MSSPPSSSSVSSSTLLRFRRSSFPLFPYQELVFATLFAVSSASLGVFVFVYFCASRQDVSERWRRIRPCCCCAFCGGNAPAASRNRQEQRRPPGSEEQRLVAAAPAPGAVGAGQGSLPNGATTVGSTGGRGGGDCPPVGAGGGNGGSLPMHGNSLSSYLGGAGTGTSAFGGGGGTVTRNYSRLTQQVRTKIKNTKKNIATKE